MTPTSTERQPSRPQVAKPKLDQAIYLRTYDVINSLDRAENSSWWEKALENVRRSAAFAQALGAKARLAAPVREMRALEAATAPGEMSAAPAFQMRSQQLGSPQVGSPVLAYRLMETEQQEVALLRTNYEQTGGSHLLGRTTPPARRVSWILLAVVAVITAGLTFAIIRFAWPPLSAGNGGERPKRAATYVTTRSQLRPAICFLATITS